jgi:GT2 family glycosyltransferase
MTTTLPRSDRPRVSIIIPCSVRTDLLSRCLQSIARLAPPIPFETIVVLNGTDPEAEPTLRAAVSGVQIVRSPVNLGVAGAGNLGRSCAHGEFLLLLHDDAEALPGWMEALVNTADAHPQAGAIGSRILNPDGRVQNAGSILWRNALTSPIDASGAGASDQVAPVDYCGTASMLVRASAWDAVGGFDEDIYPAYYVDVDLCVSLRQIGAAVLCQPKSQIHHHRNASTRSRFRDYVVRRNKLRFEAKWAAALEQYEPFDNSSKASVERALARTRARDKQCHAGGAPVRKGEPRPFDPLRQRSEHVEKERALQQAFVAHLEKIVDDAEAERAQLLQRTEALSREKQALDQAHARLWDEHRDLSEARVRLWNEHQELGQTYAGLWHERQELAQAFETLRLAHDALLQSPSWRMTAPLRHAAGLLRRMRGRG